MATPDQRSMTARPLLSDSELAQLVADFGEGTVTMLVAELQQARAAIDEATVDLVYRASAEDLAWLREPIAKLRACLPVDEP